MLKEAVPLPREVEESREWVLSLWRVCLFL